MSEMIMTSQFESSAFFAASCYVFGRCTSACWPHLKLIAHAERDLHWRGSAEKMRRGAHLNRLALVLLWYASIGNHAVCTGAYSK